MENPLQPTEMTRKRGSSIKIRTFFSSIFSPSNPSQGPETSPIKSSSFFSRSREPSTRNKKAWMSQPYLLQQEDEHGSGSSSGGEGGSDRRQVARQSSPSLVMREEERPDASVTPKSSQTGTESAVPSHTVHATKQDANKLHDDVSSSLNENTSSSPHSSQPSETTRRQRDKEYRHSKLHDVPPSLNETTSSSQAAMMSAMRAFPSSSSSSSDGFVFVSGSESFPPIASGSKSSSSQPNGHSGPTLHTSGQQDVTSQDSIMTPKALSSTKPTSPSSSPFPAASGSGSSSHNTSLSPSRREHQDVSGKGSISTSSSRKTELPSSSPSSAAPLLPVASGSKFSAEASDAGSSSQTREQPDVSSSQDSVPTLKPLAPLHEFLIESPGPSTPLSSSVTRRPSTAPTSPPPAIFSPSKNNSPSTRGMRLSLSRRPGVLMGMPPPLITPNLDFGGIVEEARTPPVTSEEVRTPGASTTTTPARRRPQTAQARLKSVPSLSREWRGSQKVGASEEEDDDEAEDESEEDDDGEEESEEEEERPMEPPLSPTSLATRRPPPLLTSFTSIVTTSPRNSPIITSIRTPRATTGGIDYFSLDRGAKITSRPSTAGTVRAGETTPRLSTITPVTTPRILRTPKILVTPMEQPSRRATQSLLDISTSLDGDVLPDATGISRGQPPEYVSPPQSAVSLRHRRSSLPSSLPPPPYPPLSQFIHPDRRPHQLYISTEPDVLPEYSNMIYKRQTLPRKMEFVGPGKQARDRKWRKVTCELEGTVLRVYKSKKESWWERKVGVGDTTDTTAPVQVKKEDDQGQTGKKDGERRGDQADLLVVPPRPNPNPTPMVQEERRSKLGRLVQAGRSRISSSGSSHSRSRSDLTASSSDLGSRSTRRSSMTLPRPSISSTSSRDSPAASSPDDVESTEEDDDLELIRSYTLQHAESGLGNDYIKRRNVIRLRCEGEQFLLQAGSVGDVVEWIEKLHMGADVSLDLDERPMPRGPLFPRRRRRRRPRDPNAPNAATTTSGGAENRGAS